MKYLDFLRITYQHRGRGWQAGDCFNLLQLFYQKELGITLPDFEQEYEEEWGREGHAYFLDLYEQWGFAEAPQPYRFGDVLLFKSRFGVTHCGVIIDPEHGYVLHTTRKGTLISSYLVGEWAKRLYCGYRYSHENCNSPGFPKIS